MSETQENTGADYGDHLIWRLVGSTVRMFGANAEGEILLAVEKDGVTTELVIGKDEAGDITLYEIERKEVLDGR